MFTTLLLFQMLQHSLLVRGMVDQRALVSTEKRYFEYLLHSLTFLELMDASFNMKAHKPSERDTNS